MALPSPSCGFSMSDHIFQNKPKPTWYVRLNVPVDVRQAFGGRSVLKASLKTGLRSEAMNRRLPYLAQWKAEIEEARKAKEGKGDEWRLAQHTAGLAIAERRKKIIDKIYNPPVTDESKFDLAAFFLEAKNIHDQLVEDGYTAEAQELGSFLKQYLSLYEKGGSEDDAVRLNNRWIALLQSAEVTAIVEEYALSGAEREEAISITKNPAKYKPRSPITKPQIERWSEHIKTQIKTQKTVDTTIARLVKISDYLSSTGEPLNFTTIDNFLASLKAKRNTLNNYLWTGRSFWNWALKYEQSFKDQFSGQPCPFDNHDLPRVGPQAGEKRSAYTKEQIESLYKRALEKNDTALADAIQFAAYTGARLEEIGRIRAQDVIYQDGIPIGLKIWKSKTDNGLRDSPIHPELLPLLERLIDNIDGVDGFLFPGGNNKYGNRLDGLSKRFGRLKKSEGYGSDYVFHSFRHSFTTLLHQAGVGLELITYLDGHSASSFTLSQYSKGPTLKQKLDAVSRLSFNFHPS